MQYVYYTTPADWAVGIISYMKLYINSLQANAYHQITVLTLWWENIFRSLWELLSGFVSTNTTQILKARKQMECANNEH